MPDLSTKIPGGQGAGQPSGLEPDGPRTGPGTEPQTELQTLWGRRITAAGAAVAAVAVLAAGLGAVALAALAGGVPDAGVLERVQARPPDRTEERRLARGATLASVFADFGLDRQDRNGLVLAFREVAEPRSLRTGATIHRRWRDDPARPHALEVVLDADRTVRLDRSEAGWVPTVFITPTTTDTLAAAGEIEAGGNLWLAVNRNDRISQMAAGGQEQLIHGLDQVFRWQIDFSRQIRPGDRYAFVVERQMRPDGSMKSERLLAAELVNRGRSIFAVWFDPEGDAQASWFDLNGESVRRAFLKKPLEFRRISSRFTNSRFHPVLRRWRAHRGVDYAADSGTPVQSTGDGVVARRGWSDSYGRVIDIRHANGFLTRYAHLSRWASGTAVGSRVAQGEIIGYVGMTGMATGPHLHYEMHQGGRAIDPLETDLPAGDPVPATDMERFEYEKAGRLALLPGAPASRKLEVYRTAPEDANDL